MKPSSLRTYAMWAFCLVEGISTAGASMRLALRMRVSMSAIGSVIMMLPARFLHARDQALEAHVAEANAAQAEFAIDSAGPTAQPAALANADLIAGPQLGLGRVALVGLDFGQQTMKFHKMSFS